jgi:hypothetical protein
MSNLLDQLKLQFNMDFRLHSKKQYISPKLIIFYIVSLVRQFGNQCSSKCLNCFVLTFVVQCRYTNIPP